MQYTIIIDDAQRQMIERVLLAGMQKLQNELQQEPSSSGFEDNALDELHNLRELFVDLPEEEAKNPGVQHGFCL